MSRYLSTCTLKPITSTKLFILAQNMNVCLVHLVSHSALSIDVTLTAFRECEWVLQVQPGKQIRLNVTSFDLEHHSGCNYDYLEIR